LAYGADAAAHTYFGKSATKLSFAEAAILAAAAESPALNPIDAPQAALQAKDRILEEMFTQELISADQLQEALEEEHIFQPSGDLSLDIAPEFTDLVLDQISEFLPMERVLRGGLNIVTTLDYDLQTQTECTATAQLARITDSPVSMENCDMARLLPSLQGESDLPDADIASSVVVLDPNSGQILALVGSGKPGLEPTRLPGRQPGSILTPFIYLTSFTRGMNPATQTWDIPSSLGEGLSDIQNPDEIFHGPVRLRTALVNDYLVPAIQILSQMGPDQVWHTTQQLGMRNLQVPPGEGAYRLPLQGGEATLLEISQAYGVFASGGILAGVSQASNSNDNGNSPIDPQVLLKVVDASGEEWLDCSGQITECRSTNRPVISPQLAYLVTNILSDETARWPSLGHPNPLEIGRPVGAKIGSTITREDTWTVGYTPDLVTAVWIGVEEPAQEAGVSPAWAAGLWHSIIQYATRDLPVEDFTPPPGITELQVCDPSGLLPTDECPHIVNEVFTDGNEPTQTDTLFQSFLINRETGRLATIFTTPALIDEEVYMVVPPEAEAWAREANIPSIPEAYDVLDETVSSSNDARITSPSMFSTMSGSVPIIGRATGEGFDFYRLQIGSGLNPLTWLQIGEDVHKPIHNGQLGVWQTDGLSGLYVLQLIVTHEDDTVESSTIQVTIDNQKPQVHIQYPQDGQVFTITETETITIQADVSDDLELAKVEYFIDGDLVTELTSPPYAIPWKIKVGEHILRVRAFDKAGNISEESLTITVER
jgi:membrane peptidoglycan carboxypeptidase